MSNAFNVNFEKSVDSLATLMNITGAEADGNSRFSEIPVSTSNVSPGDIIFFKYKSERFGEGDHLTMLIANKRSPQGIYTGTKKINSKQILKRKYMSSVKLNNVWSFTASLIISAYKNKLLMYRKVSDLGPAWISLVGRENYRTYILNNMYNIHKFNNVKDTENV